MTDKEWRNYTFWFYTKMVGLTLLLVAEGVALYKLLLA